jgi:hypothetical protein
VCHANSSLDGILAIVALDPMDNRISPRCESATVCAGIYRKAALTRITSI